MSIQPTLNYPIINKNLSPLEEIMKLFCDETPPEQQSACYTEYFRTYIANGYAHIPLGQIMLDEILSLLLLLIEKNLHQMILDKPDAVPSDLCINFFLKFIKYKSTGEDSLLISELAQLLIVVPKKFQEKYTSQMRQVDNIVAILQLPGFTKETLNETPLSICPDYTIDSSENYKAANRAYSYLWEALNALLEAEELRLVRGDLSWVRIYQEAKNIFDSEWCHFEKINKNLSIGQKNNLRLFGRSILKKFFNKNKALYRPLREYAKLLREEYVPLVKSGKWIDISENRNLWEAFLPRMVEHRDIRDSIVQVFEETSTALRYFPLYLHLGDMDQLKKRLEDNPSANCEDVISDELEKFSRESGLKIVKLLRENPDLKNLYQSVGARKQKLSEAHTLVHGLLDSAIDTAQKWTPLLFQENPDANGLEKMLEREEKKKPIKEIDSVNVPEELPESEKVATPKKVIQGVQAKLTQKPLTLEQRLQDLKTGMSHSLDFLNKKSKHFGVADALANCDVHWECLLSSMKRLMEAKEAMSDQVLFSTMIDIVRESNLVLEQMLSAFDRNSNNVKNHKELKELLTHDLSHILWSCKFKTGILPMQYRAWIREMNFGEILSRDLRDCKINGTFVERLLTKARLLSANSKAFSTKEVIDHTIEYFKRTGLICLELQKHMFGIHAQVIPVQKNFLEFCKELERHFSTPSVLVQKPLSYDLQSVTAPIQEFRTTVVNQTIQSGIDNVLNNLCVQLQAEMSLHDTLEPIDAYRHLSKIILLNQMIAEQYLLGLHDAQGVSYDLTEVDHDLSTLVESLGMKKKDFTKKEQAFLSQGKAMRLLVRYPESYAAVYAKEGPAHLHLEKSTRDALAFSRGQAFQKGNVAEGGFVIASPKLDAIKKVVEEDVHTLSAILRKISGHTSKISDSKNVPET